MNLTKGLVKWRQIDGKQKRLWLKAAFILSVIGVSLRLMSFSRFKKLYFNLSNRFPAKPASESDIVDIVWSVESAAHILPMRLLCLPQSLAVKYLLGSSDGIVMHIGFNNDASKGFEFHAWVEKHGKTIIGKLPTRYQPLWVWD